MEKKEEQFLTFRRKAKHSFSQVAKGVIVEIGLFTFLCCCRVWINGSDFLHSSTVTFSLAENTDFPPAPTTSASAPTSEVNRNDKVQKNPCTNTICVPRNNFSILLHPGGSQRGGLALPIFGTR